MGNGCCRDDPAAGGKAGEGAASTSLAYVESLPAGLQEATVDQVCDGDTFTIQEQSHLRVRLLGFDAPDLWENEPYAKEAASLLKRLCPPKSKVWLLVPPGEKKDRRNRTVAYAFVANRKGSSGYTCVNIAVVEQGLGIVHAPPGTTLAYGEQMRAAQKAAVQNRLNLWKRKNLVKKVFCTPGGIAFHTSECLAIQHTNPKNLVPSSVETALQKGCSPCRDCKPLTSK